MRSFCAALTAALLLALCLSSASKKDAPSANAERTLIDLARPVPTNPNTPQDEPPPRTSAQSIDLAVAWLASVQGADGGWGQDGGETSYVRQGERLETTGNDLANTAVATLALLRSGSTPAKGRYAPQVRKGVEFILRGVERSQASGLGLATIEGTQIQRKLGPYIDTFLTSQLLGELDGETGDAKLDQRVRSALSFCIDKISTNQSEDGSWNVSGGWAPILGTSLASQSLAQAEAKGVSVDRTVIARVDDYSKRVAKAPPAAEGASAGIALYRDAQVLEQLSRTEADREANAQQISEVRGKLSNAEFQAGFGSMGGEEFFSYLNISDSLQRTGGDEWKTWNHDIQTKLVKLQNNDGSWAGHHCITGRVAVTSAAVLTLTVERL
jgi:hypothetical protein